MDWKPLVPIAIAVLSAVGGTGAAVGWNTTAQELHESEATAARRLAKYRAAKEIGRACMGEEAFDAEWSQVLADLREAEGRPE